LLLTTGGLVAGCAGVGGGGPDWLRNKPPLLSQDQRPNENPYRVGVGDVLMVAPVAGARPVRAEVALDGLVRVGDLPPVQAAERTCAEIEADISQTMPARVVVTSYRSQSIMVAGLHEEKAPRPEVYCGPETIAQFLKRVGCPDCQTGYRVRLVRPSEQVGGEPEIFAEEVDAEGRRRDADRDPIRLQPGDYLYVERNFGRKGPLTLMTDRKFFGSAIGPAKQWRLAQAMGELEIRK
jgi:protein involved in polysaccharide export with SLBB domain